MLKRWNVHILIFILACVVVPVYALDVDEDELAATSSTSIEFINYEGPHDRIDTIEQILGIGRDLARAPKDPSGAATIFGKYQIIHAVGEPEPGKLDADILVLLSTAQVDHILNVRRIIAGYLEVAYSYELEDALLLAEFITVYNAVYRGRLAYFEGKYKPPVMSHLRADSVGISTVYSEWPGRTRVVIPLSDGAQTGAFGALHSDTLTEDEVIDELREREDQGIPIRKDMVELKEREVEAAQQVIDEERAVVREERARIDEETEAIADERVDLTRTRQEAERTGNDTQVAAVAEREQELAQREEELASESQQLDEQEAELEQREEEQTERIERIQEEREEIAEEERAIIEETETAEPTALAGILGAESETTAVLFLKSRTDESNGAVYSRLVYIDQTTFTIIAQSTTNTIRGRRIYEFADSLAVIAGAEPVDDSPQTIRLLLIDRETLDSVVESDILLSPDSWITIESPDSLLTVYNADDGWFVGRLGSDLALRRSSSIPVDRATMIQIGDGLVFVQDTQGKLVALDAVSLDPVRELE